MPRRQPSIARLAAVLLSLVVAVTILCTWTLVIALQGDDGLLAQYDAARAIRGSFARRGRGAGRVADGRPRRDQALLPRPLVRRDDEGRDFALRRRARIGPGRRRRGSRRVGLPGRWGCSAPDQRDRGDAGRGGIVRIRVGAAAYTPAQAALTSLRDVNYTAIPILAVVVATTWSPSSPSPP